jgi:hypothetical protein
VVEDDVDLAHVIGAVFAREGIEVELAHTRQATALTWWIGCASIRAWPGCRWWFTRAAN